MKKNDNHCPFESLVSITTRTNPMCVSTFQHCGPIVELTFPTFEDSGRSKGYCGILFQSPKAVAKAVELDGKELHGRWLRVQAGKMYLKQWEEQHASRANEHVLGKKREMSSK